MSKQSENKEVKLTDKQELFVTHYLASLNATDAARKSGYEGNDVTLASVGYENLRKPHIAEKVQEGLRERAMPPEEVITRLSQQARGEHARFWEFDDYGRQLHLNVKALTDAGLGHLIKKFKCHELTGTITEVEFYDAQAALEKLGKHYKLFTDKTDITSSDGSMTPTAIQFIPYAGTDTDNS